MWYADAIMSQEDIDLINPNAPALFNIKSKFSLGSKVWVHILNGEEVITFKGCVVVALSVMQTDHIRIAYNVAFPIGNGFYLVSKEFIGVMTEEGTPFKQVKEPNPFVPDNVKNDINRNHLQLVKSIKE